MRFWLFTILLICRFPHAFANTNSTDVEFERRQNFVLLGITRAQEILTLATGKINSPGADRLFTATKSKLPLLTYLVAPVNSDFEICKNTPFSLAFTDSKKGEVYLCNYLFAQTQATNVDYLAQTLIHEGAHAIGFSNECDASIIETMAMKYSGVGLKYRNYHLNACDE